MRQSKNPASEREAAAGTEFRRCDHEGCVEPGVHRAPRAPDSLKTYYWFCLDHVREYNKSWNFYAGMSSEEVERYVREDVVGWRPTWPIGIRGRRFQGKRSRFFDPFGFFTDSETGNAEREPEAEAPSQKSPEGKALAIFNLRPPISFAAIKSRYKELVKRHHPDAHGGDKGAEEKLKLINEAYGILKRFFA
jgi:DnaJ-domain-containing protein 1